jgi:hypothetical protein
MLDTHNGYRKSRHIRLFVLICRSYPLNYGSWVCYKTGLRYELFMPHLSVGSDDCRKCRTFYDNVLSFSNIGLSFHPSRCNCHWLRSKFRLEAIKCQVQIPPGSIFEKGLQRRKGKNWETRPYYRFNLIT